MEPKNRAAIVGVTAIIVVVVIAIAGVIAMIFGHFHSRGMNISHITAVNERKSPPLVSRYVVIKMISEDIDIHESDDNTISAWLHGSMRTTSLSNVPHLILVQEGSSLIISLDRSLVPVGAGKENIRCEVSLPRYFLHQPFKLFITNVSGNINLGKHVYDVLRLSTTSGDVKISDIRTNTLALKSSSGNLTGQRVQAQQAEMDSISGDISCTNLRGDCKVNSESGNVNLSFVTCPHNLTAKNTSGNIELVLPPNASFKLDADSLSGGISSYFPLTDYKMPPYPRQRSLSGKVGSGRNSISVHSGSGNVKIGQ